MAGQSPIQAQHEEAEAQLMPYGEMATIIGLSQNVELDYAPFRKSAALMDCSHRGLIKVTGSERLDYLHRMVTNNCGDLEPGQGVRAFLLDIKGRIMADMHIFNGKDVTWIDTDIHQAQVVADDLEKMIFSEDVEVENLSESMHRLSLHGPNAASLIEQATGSDVRELEEYGHIASSAGDQLLTIYRKDEVGEAGYHFWMPTEAVEEVWITLLGNGSKPAGWLAYNIARIEAGTPLFNVDFGNTSLAHETGILHEAVNFKKGCYRGQEIVARMDALGHPAKVLVAWEADGEEVPLAGAPIRATAEAGDKTIGNVSSSTFAPLRSQQPIGFAIVKWAHREAGNDLYTQTDRGQVKMKICEQLNFLDRK